MTHIGNGVKEMVSDGLQAFVEDSTSGVSCLPTALPPRGMHAPPPHGLGPRVTSSPKKTKGHVLMEEQGKTLSPETALCVVAHVQD